MPGDWDSDNGNAFRGFVHAVLIMVAFVIPIIAVMLILTLGS